MSFRCDHCHALTNDLIGEITYDVTIETSDAPYNPIFFDLCKDCIERMRSLLTLFRDLEDVDGVFTRVYVASVLDQAERNFRLIHCNKSKAESSPQYGSEDIKKILRDISIEFGITAPENNDDKT